MFNSNVIFLKYVFAKKGQQKYFWVNDFVGDMVNCSNCDCSKNLLDTILLLLDTIRAIIFFLVICSNPVNLWG